jgi:hypothetical protein
MPPIITATKQYKTAIITHAIRQPTEETKLVTRGGMNKFPNPEQATNIPNARERFLMNQLFTTVVPAM